MSTPPSIRLIVPGDLAYRDVAVRAVAAASAMIGGDLTRPNGSDHRIDLGRPFDGDVVSAFSELFNNIAIHGYRDATGVVEVTITPHADRLDLVVIDEGATFDLDAVPAPELDALPEGGMGLHIVRACMDEVSYEPGPPNVWRLTKCYSPSESAGPTRKARRATYTRPGSEG